MNSLVPIPAVDINHVKAGFMDQRGRLNGFACPDTPSIKLSPAMTFLIDDGNEKFACG